MCTLSPTLLRDRCGNFDFLPSYEENAGTNGLNVEDMAGEIC